MAKIIYHKGTGTYFGLDDDVVIIDLDRIPEKIDAEVMDNEGDEIATYWGTPIALHPDNCIDFSPQALREEALSLLQLAEWEEGHGPITPEQLEGLRWAKDASDNDLRKIGTLMLNDDEIWEMFSMKILRALGNKDMFLGKL